jgi:K+-sensing histidine kinase KdpD
MHEARETRSGRLKIFLGAAPGVGKTYAMSRAAQMCRRRGVDVVVALIETHGRQDLEEQVQKIEQISRSQIEYRGHRIEEMDLAAILKRHPELVLVDELAHSNVPGSKNSKRYLDVEELLEAGIDVLTTLNVQHIESLREAVAKITWVEVRETVPDSVLDLADEIEVIDFSPTDIIRRYEDGRLDSSPHARLATRSFFTERNLGALRELALRFAKKRPARQILVPVDGSPAAIRAIQHVVSLARAGHQGNILLLNVQAPPTERNHDNAHSGADTGKAVFSEAGHLLAAHKVPYACHIVTGKPAEAIIEAAGRFQADLIVMGTTGTSGLAAMFLGSVAKRVAEQSTVPVTLVR